jgi:histidinol phosphatase-like PHP family hydrolase
LVDLNAIVGGLLQDLATIQTEKPKTFGYKRAAAVVLGLEQPLTELVASDGTLKKIAGLGPSSTRVALEVIKTGESPTVEAAVSASGKSADVTRRRALRAHFLSRAEVRRVLNEPSLAGVRLRDYRGDFQMHSEWSDGVPTLAAIADACVQRGYTYCAVTDHSHGLPIARGMSMSAVARQHREIDRININININSARRKAFRLIKGIEANILPTGELDLSRDEASQFELVLAAPHSKLRGTEDQTDRLLTAISTPRVRILAHPRGRMAGSRAGVVADWDRVFRRAVEENVAVEIDGDPSRQDLDYTLARHALEAGCLFALDSDAHTTDQLGFAETAVAHARLAGIPASRVVNCWELDRLLKWVAGRAGS